MLQCVFMWIFIIHKCICESNIELLTDLNRCKLTHYGNEYKGTISRSIDGIRCQSWYGTKQMHEVDVTIRDTDFLDGNKKLAKNYCRNPTFDKNGPWCYTTDLNIIHDKCDIPLCNYGDCRISGTGAEYGGHRNFSYSGKFCTSWNEPHSLSDDNITEIFLDEKFSDKSRKNAGKFCRNPTDDSGGPWCYVYNEDYEIIEKEYCDIPFCDDKDCLVYSLEGQNYSTITKMNSSLNYFTIWIKLWNPNDSQKTAAKLLLSHLPIPTSAKKIAQDWGAGAEIILSNLGSGLFYPNLEDEFNLHYSPHIIIGTQWTKLLISWVGGIIAVTVNGAEEPIFIADYGINNLTLNSLYPDNFWYYGLMAIGSGVLWSTEFCQENCEIHTTFGRDYLRLWPMQRENITSEINFFVRADRNIGIQFYRNPGAMFPRFTLSMGYLDVITLVYQETSQSPVNFIRDLIITDLLDYFTWKEFHINIFGSNFHLLSPRHYGRVEILYARHDSFNAMRWFSVGSENIIAHWAFFCSPEASDTVDKSIPPNCVSSPSDYKYSGDQWVTEYHQPCIPWASLEVPENERNTEGINFPDGSALKALNKCRNPTYDIKGTYCYAVKVSKNFEIVKSYCKIHLCQSIECRVAGTANDYIGKLSVTRSGQECASWVENDHLSSQKNHHKVKLNTETKWKHRVDPAYLNDTLYPELSAKKAKNYCRDPSRSIAGPWCYTTNPLIPQDLCNVRDCDKIGAGNERRQYILPEHRTEGIRVDCKSWEPDNPDSLTFIFAADDGLRSRYTLRIGAANNERVFLFYLPEEGELQLVAQKILPHLIYMGIWTQFIVRIPRGKVELYYANSPNPIFEWTHPQPLKAFFPVYYQYTSDYRHTIAIAFDCESKCTVEITETNELTRILPVTIRNPDIRNQSNLQKIVVIIRAKKIVAIPLLLFPEISAYHGLEFNEEDSSIIFFINTKPNMTILHKEIISNSPLFHQHTWTNFTVIWKNNTIMMFLNSSKVFQYQHFRPLLFYFFTITVKNGGQATWSANCLPPDIDGPPEDGGWSEWGPWTCSASCNGGYGVRRRFCNNPAPNIRGEPCLGPNSMTGRCNTILCGDITEDTVRIIRKRMRKINTALSVQEKDPVMIISDSDIISRIINDAPETEIRWSHNGIFMEPINSRIKIENYNIVINRAEVNDSGVYTITLRRVDKTYMILKAVSLAVYPTVSVITRRETQELTIVCNCGILGYLYADLRIYWTCNKKIRKNYGITVPIIVNFDKISSINYSHHGLWECIVKQDDLNFYWTTNAILINVIDAPNWKTYLMEDEFTKPIFGLMPNENYVMALAIIIFISLIIIIIICTICFIKFRNDLSGGMSRYKDKLIKNRAKNLKKSDDKINQEEYKTLIETNDEN